MRNGLILFLLSLVGAPVSPEPEPTPAAVDSVAASPAGTIVDIEEVLGAWRGRWQSSAGAETPVEVVFRQGIRPRTVFAYVTLVEPAGERTVRRPGRLTDAGLELALPGFREVLLRSEGEERLVAPGLMLIRLRR